MAALEPVRAAASPRVRLIGPGGPVLLPAPVVDELVALTEACVSNVRHHVGTEATAWVLVEELGDTVVLTVRDDGPGIAPGRLEDAEAQGRLGVAQSIRGRVEDLGGTVTLTTGPGAGTEWEVSVPRTPPAVR